MKKIFLTGSTSFFGSKFVEIYGHMYEILEIARSDPDNPLDLLDFAAVKKAYEDFKPDVIIHTAADLGRDHTTSRNIVETNPAITKNLVDLATTRNTPFIFTSTEAVYGGKEQTGEYVETDPYKPRSPYGESKVTSEKILIASGLPYLITRAHRYVGINKRFDKPKQFPDTIKALSQNQKVHLDSHRLFKPCLINNIADVIVHYIEHDMNKKVLINLGVDKATTYYDFLMDVAKTLGFNQGLIKPDGEEATWPENSTLSIEKMKALGYPILSYQNLLEILKNDWQKNN